MHPLGAVNQCCKGPAGGAGSLTPGAGLELHGEEKGCVHIMGWESSSHLRVIFS